MGSAFVVNSDRLGNQREPAVSQSCGRCSGGHGIFSPECMKKVPITVRGRASVLRSIIAVFIVPTFSVAGFVYLGHWTGRTSGRGDLLPFDAAATSSDAYLVALLLTAGLVLAHALGMNRGRYFLLGGLCVGIVAPVRTAILTLPFMIASTVVGGAAGGLAWLVLRGRPRPRRGAMRFGAGLLGCVGILLVTLQVQHFLIEPRIRNLVVVTRSVADGGTISSYTYYDHAGGYGWGYSEVFYRLPGLWPRNEPVFELPYPETLASARRVEFYREGDRRALVVGSHDGQDRAAKRVLQYPIRWKGDPPPQEKRPRWFAPAIDFPCLTRSFARYANTHEILVPTSDPIEDEAGMRNRGKSDTLLVDIRGPGVRCGFEVNSLAIEAIDLRANRVYATARNADPAVPRNLVFSSSEHDIPWGLDFAATVDANPDAQPLPVPEGVTATVTVVQLAGSVEDISSDDWSSLDRMRRLPGAEVVCTAEGRLQAREETQLACGDAGGATTRVHLTALSGDPNPRLVALSIALPLTKQYLRLPIGWSIPVPATATPPDRLRAVFLMLQQRG